MQVKTTIVGAREVQVKLTALERNARRVLRRAVDQGTTILLRAVKAAQRRRRTGLLDKSLGKRVVTYPNSGTVVGIVGPRRGFKVALSTIEGRGKRAKAVGTRALIRSGTTTRRAIKLRAAGGVAGRIRKGQTVRLDPVFYAHLVEKGARAHMITRRRGGRQQHPGAKPYPFLAPAFAQTQAQVKDSIRQYLAANLLKTGGGE